MKIAAILFSAIVLLGLLAGCNGDNQSTNEGSGVSVAVACEAFSEDHAVSREVTVSLDQGLDVTLCSNPSTGYAWNEDAIIADGSMIEQTGHEYIEPEAARGDQPALGAPGQEVWSFDALQAGTTTLRFAYSRSFEEDEALWTFDLTVTVEE